MKTVKKGASLLLVLSMLLSMVVTCAFADSTDTSGSAVTGDAETTEPAEETAEPAEEVTEAPEETSEPESEDIDTLSVPADADDAEYGIQVLDDVTYTTVEADSEERLLSYLGGSFSDANLQIILTESFTVTEEIGGFSTFPQYLRIVGGSEDITLTLGTGIDSMFRSSIMDQFRHITLEDLKIDLNGGGLMQGMYGDLIEFTLNNVEIRNGLSTGRGIIYMGDLLGDSGGVQLNMTNVTTVDCTGVLIGTEGLLECHIDGCTLQTTANTNGDYAIDLIGDAYNELDSPLQSTISDSTISWADGSVTDESTGNTTTYAFSSGIRINNKEVLTVTDSTLTGPANLDSSAGTVRYTFYVNNNSELDLSGCTLTNTIADTQPVIYVGSGDCVIGFGSGVSAAEVYFYLSNTSSFSTLRIDDELTNDISFDYSRDVSSADPTLATAGEGYTITTDDVEHLKYVGTLNTEMGLILQSNNTVSFSRPEYEETVTDAARFKELCEAEYSDYASVTVKLGGNITMTSEDEAVTSIGNNKLIIDGSNDTDKNYMISMSVPGATAGSLTMFSATQAAKNITFQNVNIDAGSQQMLDMTGSTTGTVTMTNVNISGLCGTGISIAKSSASSNENLFENVTCTDCQGTFLSVSKYGNVRITGSTISVKALQDGDAVVAMLNGSSSAYNGLTIEGNSALTMNGDGNDVYGVTAEAYFPLTLNGAELTVTGGGENTTALYYSCYYNETVAGYSAYTFVINDSTITSGEDEDPALILMDYVGSSSYTSARSPILNTDGNLRGNPNISLTGDMYLSVSGELADTIYFTYQENPGSRDPVLAAGRDYTLNEVDMAKLVNTDTTTIRSLKLDTDNNRILYARSDDIVEMHVTNAAELQAAMIDTTYSDWAQEVIYLDNDIDDTASGTRITSMGASNIVIDGKPATLADGTSNDKTFTIYSLTSTSANYMFDLRNSKYDGYSLTFRNVVLDGRGTQRLINFGYNMAVEFQNAKVNNMNSSSSSNPVIYVYGASGYTNTSLTFNNTQTSGCTGTLICLSSQGITMTARNKSELAVTASSSSQSNNSVIYTSSAAGNAGYINILDSTLSITDTSSYAGYGVYMTNYWNLTIDEGSTVTGTNVKGTTYAVYPSSENTNIYLNECTFENTDETDSIVYLRSASGCRVHTNGQCEGALLQIYNASSAANTQILINGELEKDLKFNYATDSIAGRDTWVAVGEDTHTANATDAAHLIYTDETSPRTTGVDEDGYILLYRANISDCDITLADEDGYLDEIDPNAAHIPFYYATYTEGEIEPGAVVVADKGGYVFSASSDYSMTYENNEMTWGAAEGEVVTATATVIPNTRTNNENLLNEGELIGDPTDVQFALIMPEVTDISEPGSGYEMSVDYDITDGSYEVSLYHVDGAGGDPTYLTEGTDYRVDYEIDSELYTMTISVTGIGSYVGTLEETINLPGRDAYVAEVDSESALGSALDSKYSTIVITKNISVSESVVITYPVTIIGGGNTLSSGSLRTPEPVVDDSAILGYDSYKEVALLSVQDGGQLVVKDLTVNGRGNTRCIYTGNNATAEVTGGSVLTNGGWVGTSAGAIVPECGLLIYVDETGNLTLGACQAGETSNLGTGSDYEYGIIQNLGTLNVEEGAELTHIGTRFCGIYNEGELNWNGGQFDVDNQSSWYVDAAHTVYSAAVIHNLGTFNMAGGEINGFLKDGSEYTDERSTAVDGCILNEGTVNMSGGTITGFSNTRSGIGSNSGSSKCYGGGAMRNAGEFNMSGGAITGNTAEMITMNSNDQLGYGGGVYNCNDAVFTMSGGEISDNTASAGSGVYNAGADAQTEGSVGATFIMTGGTISGNTLFGDEMVSSTEVFLGNSAVNLKNIGSAICVIGGSSATISGGTITGDESSKVTVIDEDGNESEQEIQVGIALYAGFSWSSGVNAGVEQNVDENDCSMTVTGDPDIQVGVMLFNDLYLMQEGAVTASHGAGNDVTIDDYVLYDLFPEYYYSWLWLDGGLTSPLNVTALDMNTYEIEWVNNSTAAGYQNIVETNFTVNSDHSIIAFYPDGIEANQDEGKMLNVGDENPRQMYYYENRVNLYRNSTSMGQRTYDPIEIDTLFDYEAWMLCYHSEIDDIEWVDEVPATCEEYGTEGHYECTFCGAMFEDLECTKPLTEEDVLIDPLYHDNGNAIKIVSEKPATCTEDGYTRGYMCELCGMFFENDGETEDTTGDRILEKLGHDWFVVDEIPATATTDGQTAYCECARCGEHWTEPEVIPATGVEADKTALETAIEEAQALLDDPDSPYTEDSLATLQAAVDAATEAYEKGDISQTEVNNALADLLDAIMDLENEDSDEPDDTALQIAIDSAETLLEDEDSPYTDESLDDLAAIVAAANDVLTDPDATQEDIDAAVDAIVAAIKDLEKTPVPDTSDLEAMIDTAETVMEQLDDSDYTESSWEALEAALADAKDVADEPESQEAVDEALDALASALTGLEKAADMSALETLITRADDLEEADYTPGSWKILEDALAAAEDLLDKDLTADDQSEVDDAAEALLNAIIGLVKAEPEAETDLTALEAAIEAAKALDQDDYTKESWADLQTALDTAEKLDASASQKDVDDAAVALMNAIRDLKKVADTSTLDALITRADDLEEADYTTGSWKILEDALKAAEAIDPETASQKDVDAAAEALLDAIIGLVKSETPVDKTGLVAMIDQVEAQYPDNDNSQYTDVSWNTLQDALAEAEAVNADENATQDDVNEVLSKLMDAVMNLKAENDTGEETPNTDGLEIAIKTAGTLLDEIKDSDTYTSKSVEALEDAMNAAQDLLDNGTYNATEVSDAAQAIMDAISGLVPNTAATQSEKDALESAITAAQKLAESSDYTDETMEVLTKAIADAQYVLGSDDPTEQDVSDALQAITDAVNKLVVNTDPTASDEDKADLETVINAAKDLNSSNYTSDSWSAMQAALTAALDILSDSSATKSQVNNAMMTLTLAISSLVPTGNGGTSTVKDGFVQENGEWHYYDNGTRFTGDDIKEDLKKAIDGTDGWYYIVSGKVDFSYTGVSHFANAYGWWYINNGKVDFSCNSVEQNQYGWWYVIGGKVDFSYTGVSNYANAYGWWYIEKGKVNFGKTSIEPNNYGWWRVVDGKVDFSCNSVEQNDYGWWYVVGGKVDFSYTGVSNYSNAYGWWYISKGKVDFSCNSVEQNQYGWWYVLGGKVQFGYTGVANYANAYGWWYIREGKVDFSYTGTASNNYGTWNVVNGKVVF